MSRLSIIKKSLLSEEVHRLITYKPIQYIASTVIVWLLMLFLTLIIGLSSHLSDVSTGLTNKLWMYFYISSWQTGDTTNAQVVTLLKELENAGISAEYLSQDDAVSALEKKLPDIVQKFKDYNINAQLPSTLYVTVHNESQHEQLTQILPRYSTIIENIGDLWDSTSIRAQEQRVMKALDFSYFLKWASIALIIIFSLVMIAVVVLLVYFKLKQFEDILALKKILWATGAQMRNPFLIFVWLVLVGWFVVSLILSIVIALASTGRDQSLVYFSQLLWLEGIQTGIRWLLFNGYGAVLAIVFVLGAVIRFTSSILIELKIKRV